MSPNTRKGCLTAFLFLIVIANLAVAITFAYSMVTGSSKNIAAPWTVPVSIGLCIGNVIAAFGVWRWHRWGVVGYAGLTFISYLISSLATGSWTNVIGLAGSAILVTLILPYWKDMAW